MPLRKIPTRSFGIPRRWSNRVLSKVAPIFDGEVLNVSGWKDSDKEGRRYRDYFTAASAYHVSNFAGERGLDDAAAATDFEIDLEKPPPAELLRRFDVVFNHTTLEHIPFVESAFHALAELTRDVLIVVVPFAQQTHFNRSYGDYWRFTPMGLRHLMNDNGLEVVFEDASKTANAGVYLLQVASREPDRWRTRMPAWQPVDSLGEWIGGRGPSAIARRAINRILSRLGLLGDRDET